MPDVPPSAGLAEDQAHRLAALDAFVEFTEAVGAETDVTALARRAIDVLLARFPDGSAVYYEPDGGLWKARVWSDDLSPELVEILRAGHPGDVPSLRSALRERRPVFTNAWSAERYAVPHTEAYGMAANAPLLIGGEVRGLLGLGVRSGRFWTERDQALLRAVARGLTLALERADAAARLEAQNVELAVRARALEAFAVLSRDLAFETDRLRLVRRAQAIVLDLLPPGHAVYFELDGDVWRARAQTGRLGHDALQPVLDAGFPRETSGLWTPFSTGRPVYQDEHVRRTDLPSDLVGHVKSTAALPVMARGEPVGVFTVSQFEPRRWSPVDRAALETAVWKLGLAFERARDAALLQEERLKLESANEELEAFAYSVSHDLRTPVRHIAGFNELLRRTFGANLDPTAARYLGVIDGAARRMDALIDAMLDLSRTSRRPLRLGPVDLAALVEAVRSDLADEAGGRPVRWEIRPLPVVTGDPDALRQVLHHLLGNALKFTRGRDGAVVEVWAEPGPTECAVYVRDNGAGFDPRYRDRLFGVFQRLHRPEEFEGVGVGLANVRRLVTRHGGRVWADGAPGEGATFGFALPVRP